MTFNPFPPRQAEMGPGRLAVLLAVVAEHHERGRATERVTWEDGTSGTLRPLVRPVPFDAPRREVASGTVTGDESARRSALKADADTAAS